MVIYYNGEQFDRIKLGEEHTFVPYKKNPSPKYKAMKPIWEDDLRRGYKKLPCQKCLVEHGNYHKVGCPEDVCPICGGQLVSCGCYGEAETKEEEDMAKTVEEIKEKIRIALEEMTNIGTRLEALNQELVSIEEDMENKKEE